MAIQFGRYMLLKKIAAGGMGQVLLARKGAEGFEKLVVIKRILPHLVEDDEFFAMFLDEAKIAMRLDHPNIARINEFGQEGGVHYLEMEYVAGEDVRRVEKRSLSLGSPLPLGLTLRVIADAAAGLDFAHKARDAKGQPLNLVHRDVSPQNVLIGFDGSVKLIDFGVAKAAGRAQHTATGILKGKFPYMSPEQADGLDLDARSDVFALGIVLWELLAERRLFKGENDMVSQRLVKACEVVAPSSLSPSLPAGLDEVVLKALAKNRDDRYPDAAAFRQALEDFALANAIPTSNSRLAEFMQTLYQERIDLESDPRNLEDDSGLTGLDPGGVPLPDSRNAATAVDRSHQRPVEATVGRRTEVVPGAAPAGSRLALIAGAAVVLLVAAAVAFKLLTPAPVEPVRVVTPPPVVEVDAGVVAVVEPVKPPPLQVALTTEPAGAEVELLGQKMGPTPLELTVQRASFPAALKVIKDGYEDYTTQLDASSPTTLALVLKKRVVKPHPVVKPPVKPPEIKTTR